MSLVGDSRHEIRRASSNAVIDVLHKASRAPAALAARCDQVPAVRATNGMRTRMLRCQSGTAAASQRMLGHDDASTAGAHHLASGINAMHLENRLGDVKTDCRDRLHDLSPPIRGPQQAHTFMALTCRWRSRAQHHLRTHALQQNLEVSRPSQQGQAVAAVLRERLIGSHPP